MIPQDVLLAAISTGVGVVAGWSASLLSGRKSQGDGSVSGEGIDAPHRRAVLLESAADVFDSAVIVIDDGAPRLLAGAPGFTAVAAALGAEGGDVPSVLRALGALDPDFQRRLEALMQRGEACAFDAVGPLGVVLVEGRSSGVWAWLRLDCVAGSPVAAPEADRLRALVDGQDDPAWITSADGEAEWVNRAWLEAVTQPSLAEARARGAVLDRTAATLARTASANGAVERALSWVNSSGGRRAYRLTATPLDSGGAALWARGCHGDRERAGAGAPAVYRQRARVEPHRRRRGGVRRRPPPGVPQSRLRHAVGARACVARRRSRPMRSCSTACASGAGSPRPPTMRGSRLRNSPATSRSKRCPRRSGGCRRKGPCVWSGSRSPTAASP